MLPILTSVSYKGVPPSFHVVAPSLPNFGFSEGSTRKDFGLRQYAETCHKLMLALGYDEYGKHGACGGFISFRLVESDRLCSHPGRQLGIHGHPVYGIPVPSALQSVTSEHES